MKVGRLSAGGELEVVEQPAPVAGPGDVVVRLAACGVCGTDLEKVRGRYKTAGRIGHEPAGVVASVGSGVRGVAEGDRVAVHHHVPCGTCVVCRQGDFTYCPTYASTNIDPGGFAEMFRVPRENVERGAVHPLGRSIDWSTATLLEPAGCALTGIHRVGPIEGRTAFVIGLGPVGLLYARLLNALGASWIGGAELSTRRREVAIAGGVRDPVDPRTAGAARSVVDAATNGVGVDLAVVATGAPPAIRLGTELVRRGGTVQLFGLPDPGSRLDVDLQWLYLQGIRVIPSYATTEPEIAEVHRLVVDGRLDLRGLVSHTVPLDRIRDAFALAGRPDEAVKVAITGPAFGA